MVIVHFAGYPMNIELLKKECENRDIFLIEDVAHAPGAEIDNIKCGNMGHAGFFSFFSNKNLARGEGGMVISNNKELLRKLGYCGLMVCLPSLLTVMLEEHSVMMLSMLA